MLWDLPSWSTLWLGCIRHGKHPGWTLLKQLEMYDGNWGLSQERFVSYADLLPIIREQNGAKDQWKY
jgi:hypothetical protein